MYESLVLAVINTMGILVIAYLQICSSRKLEEVHKATNSLTFRLVETTRAEAHAAGRKEEQDRPKS